MACRDSIFAGIETTLFHYMLPDHYLAKIDRKRVSFTAYGLILSGASLLAGFALWQERYFRDTQLFLTGTTINIAVLIAACAINYRLSPHAARFFPDTNQSINRAAFWFAIYGIVNVSVCWIALHIYDLTHLKGTEFDLPRALRISFFVLSGSLIAAGLTELSYTFRQWRTNQDELEQMQEKQLRTELEAVKQQVNPHFLFNCLNSLSVLIADAPSVAEKFVDEMSKVYRYQLSVNGPDKEDILVSLESELRFIKSYIYLLETRFENGINIRIQVREVFQCGQLVPLTLQILIDHAIHHNMVSPSHPLNIVVATTETGQLEFGHNRQQKLLSMPVESADIQVLISRYRFLFNHAGAVQVKEDDQHFAIILPLIFT